MGNWGCSSADGASRGLGMWAGVWASVGFGTGRCKREAWAERLGWRVAQRWAPETLAQNATVAFILTWRDKNRLTCTYGGGADTAESVFIIA